MALKPETPYRAIAPTLDRLVEKVSNSLGGGAGVPNPRSGKEFAWQVALEFLNARAAGRNPVAETLASELGEYYSLFRAFEEFQLAQARGLRDGPPPDVDLTLDLLMRRVYTMKHDVELKVLAHAFGCRFVPWPNSPDGTGSAFLSNEERRSLSGRDREPPVTEVVEAKFEHVRSAANSGQPALLGAGHHWLAVREVFGDDPVQAEVLLHDPMGGSSRRAFRHLSPAHRFYVFEFDPERRERFEPLLDQL
ncbi:MAG: hypothetical protein Kow0069_37130 [Promethearchaeota archaeon]